jgi:hypothetical protein
MSNSDISAIACSLKGRLIIKQLPDYLAAIHTVEKHNSQQQIVYLVHKWCME